MTNNLCYITTPIYYSSGKVHIGNAYTTLACDSYARFQRLMGRDTLFLTGMDEHGQKIEEAAAQANFHPQAFVDKIAKETAELWQNLRITNDDFIRTSQPRHVEMVQKVFEQLIKQDDIYLGSYQGHYCVSCEAYFTKTQLGENETCPDCSKPTRIISEQSYFLRLKKYENELLTFIEQNPDFIQPETRKNEVISFIKSGLEDLCVSRTSFKWGIPVLSNPKHVVYVWIDALSNYLSALGYGSIDDTKYQKYWVNNKNIVHVVGKDILRFHAIYWPIMLIALKVPINFKLYVHGWILMKTGKMSKSKGNVVYPMDLVKRYGVDAIRYYLIKELPLGNDGLFSYERFVERYNNELANDLGNLLSRTIAMINKYYHGIIPHFQGEVTGFDLELQNLANQVIKDFCDDFENFRLQSGLNKVWQLINRANKYIDETSPWLLARDETKKDQLDSVLYHLVETLRIVSELVAPVLVESSLKIKEALGITSTNILLTNLHFGYYYENPVSKNVAPLFQRVILEEELVYFNNDDKTLKEEEIIDEITIDDFTRVSLKIGEIISSQKHPNASKLLVLQVKIDSKIRQIVSGIADYYNPESLVGKKIVVVTNLKPVKIRGIMSYGMILTAEYKQDIELLEVFKLPSGADVK